jgi:hypothetical protein
MVGITLTFGSVVAGLAFGQFGLATSSASLAVSLQERSSGTEVALVYAATQAAGSCPSYLGSAEGTELDLTFYNWGQTAFTPAAIIVNSTVYYSQSYASMPPGEMSTYAIALAPQGTCAHSSGQVVLMSSPDGVEVQFES